MSAKKTKEATRSTGKKKKKIKGEEDPSYNARNSSREQEEL